MKMKTRCCNPECQKTNRHHPENLSYFRQTNTAVILILVKVAWFIFGMT